MTNNISFTNSEKIAVITLASVYGLRMLGLFLIMPVIAVDLNASPGGENALVVGLVIGIYGLTQAIFQIPFGMASDKYGRKPIIILGLIIFTCASFWAANAESTYSLIFARALQGVGAVSAAASAFLADLTREVVRTKAMAMVGISIGLSFVISLVFAPVLYGIIGLDGLFYIVGILGLFAIILVFKIPVIKSNSKNIGFSKTNYSFKTIIFNSQMLRLNLSIFFLMFTQAAMFLVVPSLILNFGIEVSSHWKIYLPVLVISFFIMYLVISQSEKEKQQKKYFIISIVLILISLGVIWGLKEVFVLWVCGLCIYFVGFNLLEAFLPSWVSKIASIKHKGLALGIYNTWQSVGIFAGGLIGGHFFGKFGVNGLFSFSILLLIIWLLVSFGLEDKVYASKSLQTVK